MMIGNSFEHDFIERGARQKELSAKQSDMDAGDSEHRNIVWNAKVSFLCSSQHILLN